MGAARRPFLFGDTSSALRHLPLKGNTEDRRGGHCPSAETAEREDGIFPYNWNIPVGRISSARRRNMSAEREDGIFPSNWNLPVGADIIRPPSNTTAERESTTLPSPDGDTLPDKGWSGSYTRLTRTKKAKPVVTSPLRGVGVDAPYDSLTCFLPPRCKGRWICRQAKTEGLSAHTIFPYDLTKKFVGDVDPDVPSGYITAEREDGIFPCNWNLPVGADIIRPP